jgi:uncharacterized protein
MMTTIESLIHNLRQALNGRAEIRFAVLYGSAAESSQFRDIDVAIDVDRTLMPATADLDYAFSLAAELERLVPYPVDVRIINDAALPFRYNVSRGIALVAPDREAWAIFRERTWDAFFDFEPVARQYLREMA